MRPYVRRTSRLLLVILALLALVPSVGLARVERKGAIACQVKAAPTCCCPKEKSLSGDCCCKAKNASDCNLGSAPCGADEGTAAVVLAHSRAEVTPHEMLSPELPARRSARSFTREAVRTTSANPPSPPPQSILAS